MKRGIFGPWIGEFGWELMSWQGYVRKRALEFDEVVVCAPPLSYALYSDFSNRFIPVTVRTGISDCWRREGIDRAEEVLLEISAHKLNGTLITPPGLIQPNLQTFTKFGIAGSNGYDVLVHARHPVGKRPDHSYAQEKWNQLVRKLTDNGLRVGAIGTQAYLPDSAEDLRDHGLQSTMNLIASSGFVAGPASGPMLLSLLCDTPVLCWTDVAFYSAVKCTNRDRLEKVWNPFNTQTSVAELGWDPEPEKLYPLFMEAANKWRLRG